MTNNIHFHDLDIKIISACHISDININEWEALARHSKFINPFYEYWNLIPAIEYLSENTQLNIITVYRNHKLIALFPIEIEQVHFLTRFKLWQHAHCYDASPLILDNVNFETIVEQILQKLNIQYCQIELHQNGLFNSKSNRFSHAYQRAYINNTSELKIAERKGKFLRENSRLTRHLNQDYKLQYLEHKDANRGMREYSKLEEKSWKVASGSSINSEPSTKKYYQALTQYGTRLKNFHFQQLTANDTIIAMAVRIESQGHFFEIKTSYHNDFKKYAPGKILEFEILNSLSNFDNISVDSCTYYGNQLINRLWPNKKVFYRSTIFSKKLSSQLLKYAYIIKLIHQRYRTKHHV